MYPEIAIGLNTLLEIRLPSYTFCLLNCENWRLLDPQLSNEDQYGGWS